MRAAIAAASASLAVSALYAARRPDLVYAGGFLFGDESANLFVADLLSKGATLYRDVAYPYGPLPIYLYTAFARMAGNTPVAYVALMSALSALTAAAAAALMSRSAIRVVVALTATGIVATMPIPGATVGGYLASPYFLLERLCILSAALLWVTPDRRSVHRSLAIGAVLGICQGVRFGSGGVALTAVAIVDLLVLRRERGIAAALPSVLRAAVALSAGFAIVQLAWIAWAFWSVGGSEAVEFLWPVQLWRTHQTSGAPRWPTWGGWRMFVAQYWAPLAAGVIAIVGFTRWLGGRSRMEDERGSAVYVLLVFYAIAAVLYFRHEHHFRQFAWMLVVAAAPMCAELPTRVFAVVIISCVPALWPLASALVHPVPASITAAQMPMGCRLYLDQTTSRKVAFINALASTHPGPILILPNGSGWLYAFERHPPGRHAWFYSAAVVRRFEEPRLLAGVQSSTVIVDCLPPAEPREHRIPAAIERAIVEDFTLAGAEAGCRGYLPRSRAPAR